MNPSKAIIHSLRSESEANQPGYAERVYAGVLGKLIGVYLGRPVENWSYDRIRDEIGTIEYYIHERLGRLLIVTDDDISGTFTFLRAMTDNANSPEITPQQIGETWLNYLIEETTILWWGGFGNSTEHTAYLRLKQGVTAPSSGSMQLNTRVVAEQIGAQIFVDGWGMICPGDPESAVEYARRAASVSHDGEAIYAAQIIAALVAEAFVEQDIDRLLDRALSFIPPTSSIANLIAEIRTWHATEPDWRENHARLAKEHAYGRYGGQCPIVPNHGLIILSLLHGAGDFDRSLSIVNTSGWDTDCNSGNLGAILGVRNGLEGFTGHDWRGPVADRLYLPSTDGGRAITDAAREAICVANIGRSLAGLSALAPKKGARFHFEFPGSVQGWENRRVRGSATNTSGGALRIVAPALATTPTFIPPEAKDMKTGYVLVASPTIYPGQKLTCEIAAVNGPSVGRLMLRHYNALDESTRIDGPKFELGKGQRQTLEWVIPETDGHPIHEIGMDVQSGEFDLNWLTWKGIPTTAFPVLGGTMWARAWAKSLDRFSFLRDRYDFLSQNEGVGLLTQGCREWQDYRIEARLTPRMAVCAGLAVRVQGLRRYYAFVFGEPGQVRIDKMLGSRLTLAQTSFPWESWRDYDVEVEVKENQIRVWIDGKLVLSAVDSQAPLLEGAFGFLVEAGCMGAGAPGISPA